MLLHLRDDTELCAADEFYDVTNLRSVGHLLFYLVDSIEEARLTAEHQTIGVSNVLEGLVVYPMLTPYSHIHTAILTIISNDDIGRHVFREGSTCLYH